MVLGGFRSFLLLVTTFISGLSLSCRSNSEKRTKFKITADTLMTFARDFFYRKKRQTESL